MGVGYDNTNSILGLKGSDKAVHEEMVREERGIEGLKKAPIRLGAAGSDIAGGIMNGLENLTHLDLNGDGSVGESAGSDLTNGDVVATAGIAAIAVSEFRGMGKGGGIASKAGGKIWNKRKEILSGDDTPSNKQSMNSSTNEGHDNDNNNGSNNEVDQSSSNTHNNTSGDRNLGGQPLDTHKSSIANKSGKFKPSALGILAGVAAGGTLSEAGTEIVT